MPFASAPPAVNVTTPALVKTRGAGGTALTDTGMQITIAATSQRMTASVSFGSMTVDARIAAVWESRASAEGSVHAYASHILEDLRAIDADPAVLSLAARMVSDEERHVGICVDVASRYAGRSVAVPRARPILDPLRDVPLPLRATLRVVATSCIGESFASAWVDESAAACKPAWLHATLRRHLADEVVHARVGWAHLSRAPSQGKIDRAAVAAWLPRLLAANLHAWRTFDPCWPVEGFPEDGLPSHADTLRWIDEALQTLVLPGFAEVDIDTSAARAWLAAETGR